MDAKFRRFGVVCALGLMLAGSGCRPRRKTRSAPKSDQFADKLKPIVESKQLQVLHWPNFSDYEPLVQTFYEDRNYEVAWVEQDGQPSTQARAFIQAFKDAAQKGLNPEDYNASRWPDLLQKLASKGPDDVANFDAAMTVSVMRYISDLRIGRVNPTHFNFDINTADKKYNLPEFVSDNAVDAADVPKLIRSVEPDSDQYRKTEDALAHYLDLAKQQAASPDLSQPLPTVAKPLAPGGSYPAADALEARLQLEGDLSGLATASTPADVPAASATSPTPQPETASTAAPTAASRVGRALNRVQTEVRSRTHRGAGSNRTATDSSAPGKPPAPPRVASTAYSADLADGVKHFQARHGLTPDGKLTPATITALNVPLSARVQQLNDSLERWRWLPNEYVNAPLVVNLPEFVVRGYKPDHSLDFTMKVVVGKVVGDHATPVFAHMMKYLIFRPFWNVPVSIIKKELASHIEKSGVGYLATKNFETVNNKGEQVKASAAEVERGGVIVREKPGPKNSLGLVKFMFPNEYDIYLHSTPQPELFERTRRDFSHGCIRVQKPADLAVWVLNRGGVTDWDLDKVQEAMTSGPDSHTVSLKNQIPIVIFYLTANIGDDGQVEFFDDIYGYDKQLEDVLAKGMPYPTQQQKIDPNAVATPGDTT